MMKKLFSTLLFIAAISLPNIVSADTLKFKDVPTGHVYHDVIIDMANRGIISGYPDSTFKPSQTISRQHAALLVRKAINLPKSEVLKPYKDIPKNYLYYDAVMDLQQSGLIQADSKGNFNPQKGLTRGEMAIIIAGAFNLESTKNHPFKDVPTDTKLGKAISALYENGITSGYEDDTFKPDTTLSRAHYTLFINRAIKSKVVEEVSSETTLDSFNEVIKTNPLFELSNGYKANDVEWENKEYRLAVTEGQQFLQGTDFKYLSIAPFVLIQEPTWENKYAKNFLSAQIVIMVSDDRLHLSFDHSDPKTVEMAIKFANLLFADFNLESVIRERVTEGQNALANGELDFDNTGRININNHSVQIGVTAFKNQYSYFAIDITKR